MTGIRQDVFQRFVACFLCSLVVFATQSSVHAATSNAAQMHLHAAADLSQPIADTAQEVNWSMAAANPQRTSWTPEEVRGHLSPIWYRPMEPYIAPRVQIIAANGLLYVSTARGLYALDAQTGDEVWVYPTDLPLGHSPTVFSGKVYVGGFDRKLHAIDAYTGQGIWTFTANAGFQTNPLVLEIDGHTYIYAGNRDGYMYAVEDRGTAPALLWRYKTGGPVLFSAAYSDNTLYFASNDAHAYALDVRTGRLIWQSAKLPGAGFHSWWPVVYESTETGADVIVLAGSSNYRHNLAPSYGDDLQNREIADVFSDRWEVPRGTLIGERYPDGTIDATRIVQYLEEKPWRRTYFVLDRATGEEVTFDFDSDGIPEYAPMLWHGTHSGNRYPPVVGVDEVLYQSNVYMSDPWIPGGHVSGWNFGTDRITSPSAGWKAMDEPLAYSAGGSIVYWNHCNDRSAGAMDVTQPGTEWTYFDYNLESLIPGYNLLYEALNPNDYTWNNLYKGTVGSVNGVYGQHGDQNPPIPYQGRVYMHRSNAIIAFGAYDGAPTALPMARTVRGGSEGEPLAGDELTERLVTEVEKMLDAGHLRPGYRSVGLFDGHTRDQLGDRLIDYWHYPSDTLYTLILALPHLPQDFQQEVRAYLQAEFAAYPPFQYTHTGWSDGAAREPFDLPYEAEADRHNYPPSVSGWNYEGWTWPPHMFYALWKYAQVFGSARETFDQSRNLLEHPPSDTYLLDYPYVHNAYLSGYYGYLQLQKLAGYPESTDIRSELNRLLDLRATTFSNNTPFTEFDPNRTLSVSRNFMYLVPELASFLRDHALTRVQAALDEYSQVAPYWFVSNFEATHGEGGIQHLYDYHSLFQAKALILKEPREELTKYLDVPGFEIGDLFYIQNLVAALEAPHSLSKSISSSFGAQGAEVTYTLSLFGTGTPLTLVDTLPGGVSAPLRFDLQGTSVLPSYNSSEHRWTWNDAPASGQTVTISYVVQIATADRQLLVNVAELADPTGTLATASATLQSNPYLTYLPVVLSRR